MVDNITKIIFMKIAILSDGITPFVIGGMQKHSFNLVKYFSIHGADVTLFHFSSDNKIISDEELNKKIFGPNNSNFHVKSHCLNFPQSIKFPGHYIFNSYRYSKLISKKILPIINDFDFIYSKGFSSWNLICLKRKGLKAPNLGVNFHGYEMWQKPPNFRVFSKHLLLKPFVKWITKNSDFVFSYGSKISNIIEDIGVDSNKIIESPSGIDNDFVRNIESIKISNKRKFVFLGRYERRKGIEELSNAIRSLNLNSSNLEFHFIGDIPYTKRIKLDNIFYHGLIKNTKQIISILDEMDILICPSYSEGMPNVILESMGRGLAIIATDVGANSLLVDNDVGCLIDINNLKLELISSIIAMSNKDNLEIIKMKKNAINKVNKKYNWNSIIKSLINLISK